MTKDTKIALLVALGFLIVIGILLSDHIQTTTNPTPARLTDAGDSVRISTQTPGTGELPMKLAAPLTVTPVTVVPTGGDLSRQQQYASEQTIPAQAPIIHIGGPAAGAQESVQQASHTVSQPLPVAATTSTQVQPVNTSSNAFDPVVREVIPAGQAGTATLASGPAVSSGPVVTAAPTTPVVDPVTARQQQIRELVGAQTGSTPAISSSVPATTVYKAREGDTLSRIAQRALGANTKANRDAIVKLNPSLQSRPDVIVVGREYKIPTNGIPTAGATPAIASNESASPAIATTGNASATVWYTVREGDNLWKIAKREVGDAGAVNQILALNKDSIKNGAALQPDMKIRLPVKGQNSAVAGAND